MKLLACANAVLLAFLAVAAPASAAEDYVMKFGHVSAPNNECDDHLMAIFIKSYVESHSQGRIKVEIYPAGQLGTMRDQLEQVQNNTLECTSTTVSGIASFVPEIQVTDIPYTLRDDAVAAELAQSPFFDDIRSLVLQKTGNILLVAVGNTGSWRNFATTKKQVKTPEDLKGLKIRTIESDLQQEFVRFFGASPVACDMSELYTALSTGMVDGTKNSIGDYVPMGQAEPLNHILLDGHTYIFGFTWVSKAWLDSLPKELQGVVLDACKLGTDIQTNFNMQYQAIATEKWLQMGNTISVPTAEAMQEFYKARDHMIKWFGEKYGTEWLDKWLDATKKAESVVDARNAKILEASAK